MIKKIIASTVLSTGLLLASNSIELNVNNNTLELRGEYNLNSIYQLSNDATYNLEVSYLNSQKAYLSSRSNDSLISVGAKIINPYINDFGLSAGFGAKLVWAGNYSDTFMALPLNLFFKYELNEDINFNGNFSYSPSILSFSNASKYQELQLKANYKVIDNGYVYIGKREIKTDYSNGKKLKFDDSVFFGFKVLF